MLKRFLKWAGVTHELFFSQPEIYYSAIRRQQGTGQTSLRCLTTDTKMVQRGRLTRNGNRRR